MSFPAVIPCSMITENLEEWNMIVYLISTVAMGVLITLHMSLNARAGISAGDPRVSNVIFWLVGTLAALGTLIAGGAGNGFFRKVSIVPPWLWLAGAIGAGISVFTSLAIPKIGIANLTLIMLVGQLVASAAFSHFGFLGSPRDPVSVWKILAIILVASGTALFFYGPKTAS